jgi:Fe-S-cluster containining protein
MPPSGASRPRWETRGDATLLRRVDTALAAGVLRAGDRLACRVGCTECCIGPFPITQLDARRLAAGLDELRARDPRRAAAIRRRSRAALRALRRGFPGDPRSGRLNEDEAARERFLERHGAQPCPVLDPKTGACELYEARPLTCRGYGPPLRVGREDQPPCRLCFVGAGDREIARCRVALDPEGLEDRLLQRLWREGMPAAAETLIAYALAVDPGHRGSVSRAGDRRLDGGRLRTSGRWPQAGKTGISSRALSCFRRSRSRREPR